LDKPLDHRPGLDESLRGSMSDLEMIEKIRDNPDTTNLRVVLMGKSDERDEDNPPGGVQFLTKPFNPMRLVQDS
jgi:CheY-like chemotaxis protein